MVLSLPFDGIPNIGKCFSGPFKNYVNQTGLNKVNYVSKKGIKFLYTNADQFVNKREDLLLFISNDKPDVMMITEVIPKKARKSYHSGCLRYRRIFVYIKF